MIGKGAMGDVYGLKLFDSLALKQLKRLDFNEISEVFDEISYGLLFDDHSTAVKI